MEKNNKKRLLYIIEILKKETNGQKHISLDEIISFLESKGIEVANRKTLYDDFKILNECGYDVEYDGGYYLLEAPFNLSEIKIIQDSIYSLKNLDDRLLNDLNGKLYSFISKDEEKLLENLKYTKKHKNRKLLQRMEDVLEAIRNNAGVTIKKVNGKLEDVFPVYIHRSNDYYYFYYHYENSEKLYHYRFDNINDLSMNNKTDNMNISRKTIIDTIEASSNSYSSGKTDLVLIDILNPSEYLEQRFLDDFPNAIKTKNGFSIKVNVNNIFFAKIAGYGKDIKISNREIADSYNKYLRDILKNY